MNILKNMIKTNKKYKNENEKKYKKNEMFSIYQRKRLRIINA
jgi:hypothetical protein